MTATVTGVVPVVIVAFRNAADVKSCLRALSRLGPEPPIAVFICENGGPDAFDELVAVLTETGGPCQPHDATPMLTVPRFDRITLLRLPTGIGSRPIDVHVGEACDNLGYAGGVNAYLRSLLAHRAWPGVWILNPDTEPAPDALKELKAYAEMHGRGMVGSRLTSRQRPDIVSSRGLAWRKWRASTRVVGLFSPAGVCLSPDDMDPRLDAASGASMYVTRDCLARTGLMDERYFLYFEDLDWGLRAKRHGAIGYAHRSVVVHELGTTIGSATSRRDNSVLAVYLEFRNRILFVRSHFAGWLPWTVLMEALEIAEYARLRAFRNMLAAGRGMTAGLIGRDGRPDDVLRAHRSPAAAAADRRSQGELRSRAPQGAIKRRVKIAISLCVFAATLAPRAIRRLFGGREQPCLTVLYYHAVRSDDAATFARQMRQLAKWAHVVPADWDGEDPAGRARGYNTIVALTFDDAFESVLDNAIPILENHGFPCTIFVPAGCLGRPPSWAMETDADRRERVTTADRLVRSQGDLVTIGSHTMTHPHLTSLQSEAASRELTQSMRDLAALIGKDVRLFAFPYGDHDPASIELCRDCGYDRVFTIEPTPVVPASGAFARGRIAVDPTDGRLEFLLKAAGSYRWMPAAAAVRKALRRALGMAEAAPYAARGEREE